MERDYNVGFEVGIDFKKGEELQNKRESGGECANREANLQLRLTADSARLLRLSIADSTSSFLNTFNFRRYGFLCFARQLGWKTHYL